MSDNGAVNTRGEIELANLAGDFINSDHTLKEGRHSGEPDVVWAIKSPLGNEKYTSK